MTGIGYFTPVFRFFVIVACLGMAEATLTSCQKNTNAKTLETSPSPSKELEATKQAKDSENIAKDTKVTLIDSRPTSEVSATAIPTSASGTDNPEKMVAQNLSSVAQSTVINAPNHAQSEVSDVTVRATPTNLPDISLTTSPLSSYNFAETFARNALLAQDFHAISLSNKYQPQYIGSIQEMTKKMSAESEDSDVLFVKNMLAHHQAAIDFAHIQQKYGKDEALQRLAQDTLSAQLAEASLLTQWLKTHANKKPTTNNLKSLQTEYSQNIQDMSNAMLKGVNASSADRAFVQVLLPHHKGALAMAESELRYGKDKTVRDMAVNIISSQQGEISLMKNWLNTQHKH